MRAYIQLMRPHQWIKNFFIFLPIFFGRQLFNLQIDFLLIFAFFSFSFLASAIYCFNDLIDANEDKQHPTKRFRPIASGLVSKGHAVWLCTLLIAASFLTICVPFFFSEHITTEIFFKQLSILGFYFVLNILYSLWLKKVAIIDVLVIAIGFILRLLLGAITASIELSQWIVLLTFLLALFLAFAKRRDDVKEYEENGKILRKHITLYNSRFLDQVLTILVALTLVCYIMYCTSPSVVERINSQYLYLTSIFVLLGMIRYLQITIVMGKSGSPTKVLIHDRFLQFTVTLWIVSYLVILYV